MCIAAPSYLITESMQLDLCIFWATAQCPICMWLFWVSLDPKTSSSFTFIQLQSYSNVTKMGESILRGQWSGGHLPHTTASFTFSVSVYPRPNVHEWNAPAKTWQSFEKDVMMAALLWPTVKWCTQNNQPFGNAAKSSSTTSQTYLPSFFSLLQQLSWSWYTI